MLDGDVLSGTGRLVLPRQQRAPVAAPLSQDTGTAVSVLVSCLGALVQAQTWEVRAVQLHRVDLAHEGLVDQVLVDVVDLTGRGVEQAGRLLGIGRPTAYRRLARARAYRAEVEAL